MEKITKIGRSWWERESFDVNRHGAVTYFPRQVRGPSSFGQKDLMAMSHSWHTICNIEGEGSVGGG